MILKICPYCQTENPEKANFCKKCGALFRGQPEIIDTVAEKNKMKNKLIVGLCLLLLAVALGVILSGSSDKPEVIPSSSTSSTTTTLAPDTTTSPPPTTSTTVPTTSQAPSVNATTAPVTTVAPTLSAEEICQRYNSLVGDLKGKTTSLKVHKTEKINLEITHFSLPVQTSTINSFMARLIPETDTTYTFSNGVAAEDSKVTLSALIPPAVKSAPNVTADNLLSAEQDSQGNIALKIKPDSSSYTDGQTVYPKHVGSATDVLDFATFALGPVKIVKAEIEYPGAEIKAEVNANGELVKLEIYQPVSVMSTGGVGSITADVGMNLKATTTYMISY